MTAVLNYKKLQLIREIMELEEEAILDKLGMMLEEGKGQAGLWQRVVSPMRSGVTIEDLVAEQSYEPITAEDFFTLAEALEIEESIETLLGQLN